MPPLLAVIAAPVPPFARVRGVLRFKVPTCVTRGVTVLVLIVELEPINVISPINNVPKPVMALVLDELTANSAPVNEVPVPIDIAEALPE